MQQRTMEKAARAGYAAKGIVYAVVGILAFQAAFLGGGKLTGGKGAIETIGRQPFGRVLLTILLVGLAGYVAWRWIQAFADPDERGRDAKALVVRAMLFLSGLVYAGLAYLALQIVIGTGGGGGGSTKQSLAASILGASWGRVLVGVVALLVLIKAGAEFYKAYSAKFEDKWKSGSMSEATRRWATGLSRVGVTARGVVFLITAGFIAAAALQNDASEVKGLSGVLQTLASQPYGPWLLGAMAIGLICYAAYQGAHALYRRIPAES